MNKNTDNQTNIQADKSNTQKQPARADEQSSRSPLAQEGIKPSTDYKGDDSNPVTADMKESREDARKTNDQKTRN
ncbi:MAG: hypothetical protein V4692_02765 [Bdellovibrionota bacterium]